MKFSLLTWLLFFFSSIKTARHQVTSSNDVRLAVFVTKTVRGKFIVSKCLSRRYLAEGKHAFVFTT